MSYSDQVASVVFWTWAVVGGFTVLSFMAGVVWAWLQERADDREAA